jgi:hypothetical protein
VHTSLQPHLFVLFAIVFSALPKSDKMNFLDQIFKEISDAPMDFMNATLQEFIVQGSNIEISRAIITKLIEIQSTHPRAGAAVLSSISFKTHGSLSEEIIGYAFEMLANLKNINFAQEIIEKHMSIIGYAFAKENGSQSAEVARICTTAKQDSADDAFAGG